MADADCGPDDEGCHWYDQYVTSPIGEGDIPPDSVMSASKTCPALEDCPRNTIQAKILVKISPTQGTPALFARPMNFGALLLRDMKRSVREATYKELFPAEITLMTIRALIRCAAGRIPASAREMVKGELAVVEVEPRSRLSVYGRRMPMKKIVPVSVGILGPGAC